MNHISVKLTYKESGCGWIDKTDLNHLHNELKENYVANIRPNGNPQAGGMVDAFIEVIMNTSFIEFFTVVKQGLMFDAVIRGKKSLVLKPLFNAFKRMEQNNKSWDYTKVRFLFDETEVVVYGMSNLFTSKIGTVFIELSNCYSDLGTPDQILIPISKELNEDGTEYFANYGGGEDFDIEEYTAYWGLVYAYGFESKIYDVQSKKILDVSWKH